MGLRDLYIADPTMREEGAWVLLGAGVRWCLRSVHSKRVRAVQQVHQKKYYRKGHITDDEATQINIDLIQAATVAWEGVTDEAGQPVPCTAAHVLEQISGFPGAEDLREDLISAMRSREQFRSEELATQGKGSATPSGAPSAPAPIATT